MVCCTHNGGDKLIGLLSALENLRQNSGIKVEFIFVVDGSIDGSVELLEAFKITHSNLNILIIRNVINRGLSESRNIGIARAKGDYVAFLDDDCRPSASWLDNLNELWGKASNEITGIGGYVYSTTPRSLNQTFCEAIEPVCPVLLRTNGSGIVFRLRNYYSQISHSGGPAEYLAVANMSFRKEALLAVDCFLSSMHFGGDDEYICSRLRARYGNECLLISMSLPMHHEYSLRFFDSLRRSFSYGRGAARNYLEGIAGVSLNPGPVIALLLSSLLALGLQASALDLEMGGNFAIAALMITLSYSLFVGSWKFRNQSHLMRAIGVGFGYLLCESANVLGFISYWLMRVFRRSGGFK